MGVYNRSEDEIYSYKLNEMYSDPFGSDKRYKKLAQDVVKISKEYKIYKKEANDSNYKVDVDELERIISDSNTVLSNVLTYGGISSIALSMCIGLAAPIITIILDLSGLFAFLIGFSSINNYEKQEILKQAGKALDTLTMIRDKTKKGSKEYKMLNEKITTLATNLKDTAIH